MKVIKETVFNLSGEIDSLDLRDLIVGIFNDDYGILSGELSTEDLKISGSRKNDDIQLIVDAQLKDFKFSSTNEDSPSIDDLDCDLKVNQNLNTRSNFSLSSLGNCTSQEFSWDRTGSI